MNETRALAPAALEHARDLLAGHPYHVSLAAAAVGLATSPLALDGVAVAAAVVAAVLAAWRLPVTALCVAALLIAGAALGEARLEALDSHREAVAETVSFEGSAVLVERPRPSKFGSSAEIEILSGALTGARLMARSSGGLEWPPRAAPGMKLVVGGTAAAARTSPGADFDYPGYLRRRGVAGELELREIRATGDWRGGPAGFVDRMRVRAEKALDAGLAGSRAALIRGMVLGQDAAIPTTVRDDFRAAGLAHLLAVSGQNVMLLGLLVLPLFAALGLGARSRLIALLALIAVYVPLAGAGASLQRAGVMGAAGIVAMAVGRPASRVYALLLAAAATLALNPRVTGDPGWQLSFLAVVGIFTIAPLVRRPLHALPRPLLDGIAITVAATLATLPMLAHHFEAVSLVSLPANLLALPAVAPAMWIGMLQTSLGQLTVLGPPLDRVALTGAGILGSVNDLPLGYLEGLARRCAEVPNAQVGFRLESPAAVAATYAALAAAILVVSRLGRRIGPAATAQAGRWRTAPAWQRHAVLAAATAAVVAGTIGVAAPPPSPDRLTVSFLDVGQGDATLVQHPDGAAVLFDGGPVEARAARLVRRAGVRRLSAIVATHASADHHGGLEEVLERVPVDVLVDGGDGTTDPTFRAMLATADRLGVRRVAARAGQTFAFGDLRVEVLSPFPRAPGPPPEDPNPRAVAAVVSAGDFDLFLSGDAESPSLLPLPLPDVEAMKVSHHGSADPGLPEVLTRLSPEVAAIEVGENTYGHPTPSTLAALEGSGARVYRTDRDGTVQLTVEAGEMQVDSER